jgi:sulfite exporter TauE/SafE
MTFVLAALIMGFAGSLHCIGMCGPLVMAVHTAQGNQNWWYKKFIYHAGRLIVYGLLGLIVGAVGQSFVAVGFQQWVAIAAGVLMMLFLAWPAGMRTVKKGPFRFIGMIKTRFASLIQRRNAGTHFLLGALNGLLPCGLVYVALAASLALANAANGMLFMMVFGLATTPALIVAGAALQWLGSKLRVRSYRFVQFAMVLISFIVILRGANLGIPYLSPQFNETKQKMDCCHKP